MNDIFKKLRNEATEAIKSKTADMLKHEFSKVEEVARKEFSKVEEAARKIFTKEKEDVKDLEFVITDRNIASLRETVSRINRQVTLIKEGNLTSNDENGLVTDRMDIIAQCSQKIDELLVSLEKKKD